MDLKDARARSSAPPVHSWQVSAEMLDDGSTARAASRGANHGAQRPDGSMWIYTGVAMVPTATSRSAATTAILPGSVSMVTWGFSWPANRRIQYNRASADPEGMPWSESKKYMFWNGQRWTGPDVPDYVPTIPPERATGPFIMNPEGRFATLGRGMMTDGPFPCTTNPSSHRSPTPCTRRSRAIRQPRVFKGRYGSLRRCQGTSRSWRPPIGWVEHFHYWTKGVHMNAVMQPEFFVELSEELAKEKGIRPPVRAVSAKFGEGDLMRRSASTVTLPAKRQTEGCQADRRVPVHRLQGLPDRVPEWNELREEVGVNVGVY